MKKSQQHEWRSHGKKTKNEKRSIDRSIGTPPPPATPDGPSELESDLSSLFSSGTRKDPESRRDSAGSLTLELTPSSGKIGMIISPRVSNLPPRTISKVHQKRLEALNNPRSKEEEEEKQGKERKQGEEKKKEEMKKYDEAMAKMAANREKFVKKKNEEKTEKKENAAIPTRAAESTPSQQRVKKLSKRKAKGQSVNGAAPAVGEEESDEEESANWTSMRPFVPLQKNGMGEKSDKKQLKSDRKREKREAEERERRNSVTTVLSYPPATVSQEKTKEKEGSQVAKPDIVPTVSSQPPSTVSSPPSSTTAVGSEKNEKYSKHGAVKNFVDTVPSQSSTSVSREPSSRLATVSREPSYRPATVFKTGRPATVFQTGRPATVRHADNHLKYGKNGVAKPVHTVFYDSSPEKKAANNDAVKSPVKPIDRSTEESSPRRSRRLSESSSLQQTAAASATPPPAATPSRHNGRVTRDSSPEVSSTSSESSDDERAEERRRSKKVVVRPEVTSSISKRDTAVTASPAKNDPPSKTATPLKEKRAKEEEEKGGEEVVKEEKKEKSKKKKKKKKDKNTVRPSTDLLRMVAERLANGHGLMVFRLISSETRRIAEEQLRRVDDVLHLEEFDDENAFTRDDMTEWWEQRREVEDETVSEGKETLSHTQISAYLNMRKVEKRLLTDMDGGLSNPRNADSSVQPSQLLQHPLAAIDASCLLHESQTLAATRLLQHGCKRLQEVWLGHCKSKLVREVPRLAAIERFEHRQATMETLDKLPLLQMTELRLDIVDESVTAEGLADHLVNCQQLRALELNVAPTGIVDGNTSTHYALFTRRCYDRENYTDDLEWMVPNVEEGEPDPITLCTPSLEHLATNVANVKLLWQLRDSTLLLRHLRSLRVGTLSRTKELITSSELFCDTKEARRYKPQGFFALRDAYETELESVTLRLGDRVGMCGLRRDVATIFESIGELPPSLRRFSASFFYNQFAGVCAPFRRWTGEEAECAPDTDHIGVEEIHLHFERAFDLRGLPLLLSRALKTLSIAVHYENEEDAKCLGSLLEMLPALERLENLQDLHIQVWGVRCLQPVVAAVAGCSQLAARLTRLAVAAYPVDDAFFETDSAPSWIRSTLTSFPLLDSLGLHTAVLARLIPEERRSGYSWRNGLAWLANETLSGEKLALSPRADRVELAAAGALPALEDGEEYTITPHWEVDYDAEALVLCDEEEEMEGIPDTSYSRHGAESSEDDFITDGEDEEEHGGDELDVMEEGLEEETERIEKREKRRDEKVRAAIERGEMKEEGEEEEEGEVIDFDSISDGEEDEPRMRSDFVDDEAVESDREESDEEERKGEESADGGCPSDDDDRQREEEEMREEGRRQKRIERKQAKIDNEVERQKRKRRLASDDEEEEEEVVIRRPAKHKRVRTIIDSDDD